MTIDDIMQKQGRWAIYWLDGDVWRHASFRRTWKDAYDALSSEANHYRSPTCLRHWRGDEFVAEFGRWDVLHVLACHGWWETKNLDLALRSLAVTTCREMGLYAVVEALSILLDEEE